MVSLAVQASPGLSPDLRYNVRVAGRVLRPRTSSLKSRESAHVFPGNGPFRSMVLPTFNARCFTQRGREDR